MNLKIDYYAILGVSPSAEDVVIRAAYKALAQRYHPDRYNGPKEEANRRMAEIIEAYATLSDAIKRRDYDQTRGPGTQSSESFFDADLDASPSSFDPLDRDWQVAVKYYPDLQDIENRLAKIAWRLAYSYRAYLLEIKDFEKRHQLADAIEAQFLKTYFGSNPLIVDFAKSLVFEGNKKAALVLNEVIRVLGDKVDPIKIIINIRRDHASWRDAKSELGQLLVKIIDTPVDVGTNEKIELITLLGGDFKWLGFFSCRCSVTLNGKESVFNNAMEFSQWVVSDVVPTALTKPYVATPVDSQ